MVRIAQLPANRTTASYGRAEPFAQTYSAQLAQHARETQRNAALLAFLREQQALDKLAQKRK